MAQASRGLDENRVEMNASIEPGKPQAGTGQVYAVLSGHPHEAIAFFAEHLSLAIVERVAKGERVLLIDLATPAGAAAIFLNLSQTYSALDALDDADRFSQTLVDTSVPRHASGLHVLSLPEDLLGRARFDAVQIVQLIGAARRLFAHTVVAMDGHAPLAALVGAIGLADRSLLLSDQSILKSRHNKHLLRALRQQHCALDRCELVVDNYRRRLGLDPRNLAELFGLPLLATLETESYNRIVSMNSGEPLYTSANKDPYCEGVRKLAAALLSGKNKASAPLGFFERILG